MSYGHFSDDGREYIFERPDTPRPWINYLSNDRFASLISQTGGGFHFLQGAGFERITRGYPGDMLLYDRPGRYLYLRDAESEDVWSLGWQPVRKPLDSFEARHGLGYTVIKSIYREIEGEITHFVPLDQDCEVWRIRITNKSNRPRQIQAFSYCEWVLGAYQFDLLDRTFANLFNETQRQGNMLLATKRIWRLPDGDNRRWDKWAFMASSRSFEGFDCDKEAFVGTYHDLGDPCAVLEGRCQDSNGTGKDACAAMQFALSLEPGETVSFELYLGVGTSPEAIQQMVSNLDPAKALADRKAYHQRFLEAVEVKTPDSDFNRTINVWNPYQAWVTSRWARMASFYAEGKSVLGFRDSCQDIYGILPYDTEWALEHAAYILSHQFPDGDPMHVWEPLQDQGEPSQHSDDPLWIVFLVTSILKETGNFDFLQRQIPFQGGEQATVLEHLKRALAFSLDRRSERGLSLFRQADWNDALDHVGGQGKGESTFNTFFLLWALKEVKLLAERLEDSGWAASCQAEIEKTEKALAGTWRGEWFDRGTLDDGTVFGRPGDPSAEIWLNPQTWAVISGFLDQKQGVQLMDTVAERLRGKYGPALFLPGFQEPDPRYGIITRFAPGTKENGTVFHHPVCWTVLAECMLGRGDRAYAYWKDVAPMLRDPEVNKAEPYAFAEFTYGPDHPQYGQSSYTWTTGSAAWMLRVCLDGILGLQPTYDGLVIKPCLPTEWKGVEVKRQYRGATYQIRVERGTENALVLDGKELPFGTPLSALEGVHTVQVRLA